MTRVQAGQTKEAEGDGQLAELAGGAGGDQGPATAGEAVGDAVPARKKRRTVRHTTVLAGAALVR